MTPGGGDPLRALARKHGLELGGTDSTDEETPLEKLLRENRKRARDPGGDIVLPPNPTPPARTPLAAARIARARGAVEDAEPELAGMTALRSVGMGVSTIGKHLLRGVAQIEEGIGDTFGSPSKLTPLLDRAAAALARNEQGLRPSEESTGSNPWAAAGGETAGEFAASMLPYHVAGIGGRPLTRSIGRIASKARSGELGTVAEKTIGKLGAGAGSATTTREGLKRAGRALPGHLAANIAPTAAMDPNHNPFTPETIGFSLLGALMEGRGPRAAPAAREPGPIVPFVQSIRRRLAHVADPTIPKELETAHKERRAAEREANIDELTGLGSKGAFARARATAEADPATAIVRFDVNGMKAVNDLHGHGAGDKVLTSVADAIHTAAKEAGIGDRGFRVGGDEFTAIVPADRAEAFRNRVEDLYGVQEHGKGARSSISGGFGATDATADAAAIARKTAHKATQAIVDPRDVGGVTIEPPTPLEQLAERNGLGPSSRVVSHPVAGIHRDPARFQFKQDVDERGVGRNLSTVEKYNPDLAGSIALWKDPADGLTYVVNGHHRLELAERTGTKNVDAYFIDATDAAEARAHGALANIAEGQGTALDAAKFFRDAKVGPEALKAQGVELSGRIAKAGLSLSKLEPDVFSKVATGKISENHGAIIGGSLEAPEMQRAAASLVENSPKRLTDAQVSELVGQVRAAGTEQVKQDDLFGTDKAGTSLIYHRADVAAEINKRLSADKRLFGYVAKGTRGEELARGGNKIDVESSGQIARESAILEEVFRAEAHAVGEVGSSITEAARRVANGESVRKVVDDIYEPVREAVQRAIPRGGQADGGAPPATGARGEPAAAEATGSGAREGAAGEVVVDPSQEALFAPGARDLFGEPTRTEPEQTSLLGGKEGTEGARNLRQTEAAARSELEKLHQQLPLEKDPRKTVAIARRISELEKLVNRDQAITAQELATRAIAGEAPIDSEALFSPAAQGPLRRRVAKIMGDAAPAPETVKALIQITRNLANATNPAVRQGRFMAKQRKALGVFFTKSESIRVSRLDDVSTVAHEIGHYLSKHHLDNPTRKTVKGKTGYVGSRIQLSNEAKQELLRMGHELYGSRKPAGGYGEEGIAQYFSFFVTDPARMLAEAPNFHRFMESTIYPKEPALKDALDQARVDFADYTAAPASARVDAMISVDERVRNRPTVRAIVNAMFDDLNEFKLAVKELGGERDPAKNAYTLARLTRGDAGRAEEMIERGVVDFATRQRLTRGVEEILKEIPRERLQAFRRYLVAERALEVGARGVDSGISLKDAAALKAELEGEFRKPAEEIWDISQKLIDYRRDAGLLTEEQAKLIKEKNQRRVGFYRLFDESEAQTSGAGSGRGYGRNSSGIQKMRGSARRIIDPLESLVTDIYKTVHQSQTHDVLQQLVSLARRTEGGGRIAEVLTERPKHLVQIPIQQVMKQLHELGFEIPENMPEEKILRLAMGVLEDFQYNVTAGPREAKDMVIPYVKDGERFWVQLKDRRLYDSIKGLDRQELPMWARILTAPVRTLRAGATLTAEFITRNPARDAWSASIYSQAGFRPPGYDFARGMFSLLKKDELYQMWRLEGGDNAAMLGLDRSSIQRSLKSFLRSGPEQLRDVVIRPIDTLRLVSSAMENATRLGEFKAVFAAELKKGGPKASAAKTGTFASRDVTLDFAKSGWAGVQINRIVAFFNANLLSSEKLVRELRERPQVILPRIAATITLPSLVLWALQRNDPAYRNLPRWRRDLFWNWVQRGEDGKVEHIWSWPKSFELGILFGTVPERIAEYIDDKDPQAFDGLLKTLIGTLTPGIIPTGALPLIENWANKSWFRDRPVVPRSVERFDPERQAGRYASETARLLGKFFNYPPAKIDNLIRGWTGGLGSDYAVKATDVAIRGARRLMGKEPLSPESSRESPLPLKIPGVRGFSAREPGADAESVERVYRRFGAAEERRQTWKSLLSAGKGREASTYLKEHREEILSVVTEADAGSAGPLRAAYTTIGKLQDLAHDLEDAKGMPAEQRQEKLRKVYDAMIRVAENATAPRETPKPPPDPVALELDRVGAKVPAGPDVRKIVASVMASAEYRKIDEIAEQLVEKDPKYSGRSRSALARELKKGQIEEAVAAYRRQT